MVKHARDGMKDTIESIVIALVLAFVFRAFVVEAFVIPTGSMAPTLYGAHATIICEDCGYEFAYGLRDPEDARGQIMVPTDQQVAICPNCNHVNRNLQVRDGPNSKAPPEKGDRILVLKWPFDLGGQGLDPARWDVIVFKDPSDGTTNFIKRCAGVPNEVLAVIDGDVYTVPASELSPQTRAEFEAQIHHKYLMYNDMEDGPLAPLSDTAFAELDKKFRIARKTPEAQKVLWFPVYDNDHPPRNVEPYQPRWLPAMHEKSGWKVEGAKLHFEPADQPSDFVVFTGKEIRATNSYNIGGGNIPLVSDQRLRFVVTPQDGQATVRARLTKWRRSFWANISMDGRVMLSEGDEPPLDAGPYMARGQLPAFAPGKPFAVEFENVDYRLVVRVDGKEALASSSDPNSPAYYGPNITSLRKGSAESAASPPRLYGEGGALDITHLILDRDVYYYHESRGALGVLGLRWAPKMGWGDAKSPILLREGEYFMLGDNTAASKDSRLWDMVGPHLRARGDQFQLGTVPRDQLIGKAFFVYWPSGHRVDWLPLLNRFGLIPDVGRMRWIR